jgi:hypothetical protein
MDLANFRRNQTDMTFMICNRSDAEDEVQNACWKDVLQKRRTLSDRLLADAQTAASPV